jgi:transposase
VADAGMLNEKNLKELEEGGLGYIVGARLKNMSQRVKEQILDRRHYQKYSEEEIAQFDLGGSQKLVVSYQEDRAKKDAFDRQREIERLKKKLQKSHNPKEYLSNSGCGKYLKLTNPGEIELDEAKIQKQSQWDGLHGVITNAKELSSQEIVHQYVQLWHVEEAFRITKHDLKIRPVFHWTKERIQAHIALCFTAYALVRHLQYRVRLQYQNLSIEAIRQHLIRVQTSILYHLKKKIRFALPSRISQEAKRIYALMNLTHSLTPWLITHKV